MIHLSILFSKNYYIIIVIIINEVVIHEKHYLKYCFQCENIFYKLLCFNCSQSYVFFNQNF